LNINSLDLYLQAIYKKLAQLNLCVIIAKTNQRGLIMSRRSVGLDEYTNKKMQDKIDEANEQRQEQGKKPIRVCDFMAEAVDRVTVAQLVRV